MDQSLLVIKLCIQVGDDVIVHCQEIIECADVNITVTHRATLSVCTISLTGNKSAHIFRGGQCGTHLIHLAFETVTFLEQLVKSFLSLLSKHPETYKLFLARINLLLIDFDLLVDVFNIIA